MRPVSDLRPDHPLTAPNPMDGVASWQGAGALHETLNGPASFTLRVNLRG
ncbi:MAG: hypothetical protein WA110_05605 [Anaerolineaceae bacterium]